MHKYPHVFPKIMEPEFHVLIIGGGVVGCAVAQELSKYELKTALVEKGSDVCCGASKANSGVVHSGIYSEPGSLKARLCVEGNNLFSDMAMELGVEFERIGKLVVARNDDEALELEKLKDVGEKNKVPDLEFIEKEELEKLEPNILAAKALWVPTAGIVSPYKLTIALAENAQANGVHVFLNTKVQDISVKESGFIVKTNTGEFRARYVVNSAGLYCDNIVRMVGIEKHRVYPCKGEYIVLDKSYAHLVNHLVYPPPENGSGGLGIHLTPTLEGNILIGPSAEYIDDKENTSTTRGKLDELLSGAGSFLRYMPKDACIQSYAGIRCKLVGEDTDKPGDFIIEEDETIPGFINLMGIESPGLSASPAIARMVVDLIKGSEELGLKKNFLPRKSKKRFHALDLKAKARLIQENPNHGHLICRCENVTEQEIMDALSNPLGARTLSSIKYRCRATMGRCQGGFCKPRIIKLMEELYHPDVEDITLLGKGSHLFIGRTKDLRRHEEKES